jgi:hypothetical protein
MKHYKYKLVNLLREVTPDDSRFGGPGTGQFYGGNSSDPDAVQAGMPGNADINSKAIADVIATGVKVLNDTRAAVKTVKNNTKLKSDIDMSDLRNPTAAGKISYKSAGLSGEVDISGNLDANLKIKLGDPPRSFDAKISGNVSDLKDIYNKPFNLSFTDKQGKKNNLEVQINPDKKYSFSYNKSGNTLASNDEILGKFNFGFDIKVPKDMTKSSAGIKSQFKTSDKKSYSAAVNYGKDKSTEIRLNFAKTLEDNKVVNLLGGTGSTANVNTFVYTNISPENAQEIGGGIQFTVTGRNKGKTSKTKSTNLATKAGIKAASYIDFGDETKIGGLKTIKGPDGEVATKFSKDVDRIKQDVQGATRTVKKATDLEESIVTITKKNLNSLIEKLLS